MSFVLRPAATLYKKKSQNNVKIQLQFLARPLFNVYGRVQHC